MDERRERAKWVKQIDAFVALCSTKHGIASLVFGGDFNAQLPGEVMGITGTHVWRTKIDDRADVVMDFLKRHKLKALNTWRPPDGRGGHSHTWVKGWRTLKARLTRRQYDYICASNQDTAAAWVMARTARSDHYPVAASLDTKRLLPRHIYPARSTKGWKPEAQDDAAVQDWINVIKRCDEAEPPSGEGSLVRIHKILTEARLSMGGTTSRERKKAQVGRNEARNLGP